MPDSNVQAATLQLASASRRAARLFDSSMGFLFGDMPGLAIIPYGWELGQPVEATAYFPAEPSRLHDSPVYFASTKTTWNVHGQFLPVIQKVSDAGS